MTYLNKSDMKQTPVCVLCDWFILNNTPTMSEGRRKIAVMHATLNVATMSQSSGIKTGCIKAKQKQNRGSIQRRD